jgi:hypothetical protein
MDHPPADWPPCVTQSEKARKTPARWVSGQGGNPEKDGAGEGTRTPDPIITNDVLYQLSYTGILFVRCSYTGGKVNSTRTHVIPDTAGVMDLTGEQASPIKARVLAYQDMTIAVPDTASRRQVAHRRDRR